MIKVIKKKGPTMRVTTDYSINKNINTTGFGTRLDTHAGRIEKADGLFARFYAELASKDNPPSPERQKELHKILGRICALFAGAVALSVVFVLTPAGHDAVFGAKT